MNNRRSFFGVVAGIAGAVLSKDAVRAIDDVQIVQSGSNVVTNSGNRTDVTTVTQQTQQVVGEVRVAEDIVCVPAEGTIRFLTHDGGGPTYFEVFWNGQWCPFDLCSWLTCRG